MKDEDEPPPLEPGPSVGPSPVKAENLKVSKGGRVLRRRTKSESKPRVNETSKIKGVGGKGTKVQSGTKGKGGKSSKSKSVDPNDPYPEFLHPSEDACYCAHATLSELYGQPVREAHNLTRSLLDSLCRTILSQNTTDTTSAKAFANLKAKLPTWKAVLEAAPGVAEDAIRCGGLADVKMYRIRLILQSILQTYPEWCKGGEPTLRFLKDWPTDQVKKYLLKFKGVGPKTVSCVLMFAMRRAEFPVDTHVWKIALKLGWVPKSASRETTYLHLNRRIPDKLKYDLHVLLVKHGKVLKNALGKLAIAKAGSLGSEAYKIALAAKLAMSVKVEKKGLKRSRAKKQMTDTELAMTGTKKAKSATPKWPRCA